MTKIRTTSGLLFNRFRRLSLYKKGIFIAACLLIIIAVSSKIFGPKNNQVQYQTAIAERGTLISSITASGNVSTGNSASITTSATGIVKDVYVKNGDIVNQGDSIAEINLDTSSEQKQEAAWANYLAAQNTLNSAKAKMNSLQSALFTANQKFVNDTGIANPITDDPKYIIERADWLQAEADYNNQKGVITQAEAALSSAWLAYSQTSEIITAPMSGTVSNLTLTYGSSISGNNSTTGSTNSSTNSNTASSPQSYGSIILQGGETQATVNLTEIDVTKAEVGQKATITMDAFPDKSFTGKVVSINTNGSVSSGVTTYPATITFDSAIPSIYPNMAVNAKIITKIKNDVILVPSAAVQTTNGESTLRTMKNNKPTSISVEVGDSNDTQTEIISGIKEGDTVITGGMATQQTGSNSRTQTGTSPFGNSGFGGNQGGAVFRQRVIGR